jgi:transcriptional regulator with XRE-family HTH domain
LTLIDIACLVLQPQHETARHMPPPAKTTPLPNPSDLRMILGDNLRRLCAETDSISALCRQIGVNRTQFNRYLTGTAFPRPDVLYRICAHFRVDANILLKRLEDLPSSQAEQRAIPLPPIAEFLMAGQRPFDHYLLPDGMYRFWRKSFRQPDRAYQSMATIRTKGSAKIWKGYDVHDLPFREGSPRHARSSSYYGTLVQQFDGFALISGAQYSDLMNFSFFEYGLDTMPDYYSGISFVTRRRLPDANRVSASVLQRMPADCRVWLAWARRCGSLPLSELPKVVQNALNRIPDQL